ncbi:MAG: hypothetical protein FJX75_28250 [Armatimonadetes bacterium]|nr:hypothetical protein [Armatimonadota bacterium]
MRDRVHLTPLVVFGALVLLGAVRPASAIPVFARKYGFNCTMCHSTFPRLNDFGQRYRANGYQLPGREQDDKTILESPVPLAMRTTFGYTNDSFDNVAGADDVSLFRVEGLDLLSGGLLGKNIGYFTIYTPEIGDSNWVEGQPGTLEMANVMFSNLCSTKLNVRLGRFEPAYVPFSVKRNLSRSPYEIYEFAFPGGPPFSDTQVGIELTGYCNKGYSYALGWLDGSETNDSDDTPSDVYFRLAKVFGQGEGQTAGQRLGFTGYFGRAKPDGAPAGASREGFDRFGVDLALNHDEWNLGAQVLWGCDDAALWGTPTDVDFSGGFVEVNYLPTTRFTGFTRFDWVSRPLTVGQDVTRFTIGGRYHIQDNLAIHGEYSHGSWDIPRLVPNASEDFFTARLDWAF